ncbi:MAG: D-alanyl-D-alanine carboxypeptidase, partial [Prevotella shahii]|nr:D-alanyl-D-alanine carboxypeptidase [Hoylesella shahii]
MMNVKNRYIIALLMAWLMALTMMGQVEKDTNDDEDETVAVADTLNTDSI